MATLRNPTPDREIMRRLRQGQSKTAILSQLARHYDRDDVVFVLNTLPAETDRKHYLPLNLLLCLTLLALTLKQLYFTAMLQLAARAANQFSPLLLLDLIVPVIHFYILGKLIRFQRQGYQMMLVLGVLALVRPENRLMPDLAAYGLIIVLCGLLLAVLYPRSSRLS